MVNYDVFGCLPVYEVRTQRLAVILNSKNLVALLELNIKISQDRHWENTGINSHRKYSLIGICTFIGVGAEKALF